MAKYRPVNYEQDKFIPIAYSKQILPGTFEYSLSYIVDHELDLSVFDSRYHNDEAGAPAIHPAVLLKVIIYAYSRGITSSRDIEQACRDNVIFMALSADTQPHFTTIAGFVSGMGDQIVPMFRNVLMICDELNLIGRDMFAIDGCKLPSNASKEWSGTKAELTNKKNKLDKAVKVMLEQHCQDDQDTDPGQFDATARAIEKIKAKSKKIKDWLDDNDDKPGKNKGGKPIKSNITDNDSATIKTSRGVVQGYNGVSCVDSTYQVVVHAETFGQGPERDLLQPVLESTNEHFNAIGEYETLNKVTVMADSGFYTKANVVYLFNERIDGYLPDDGFRKRDPRFSTAARHQVSTRKAYRKDKGKMHNKYSVRDFHYDAESHTCVCPAGKHLYSNGRSNNLSGYVALKFTSPKSHCLPCSHRDRCFRDPDKTPNKQISIIIHRHDNPSDQLIDAMKEKIDSTQGRQQYSRRMGIVEPVFGNITNSLGLNRFSLRTLEKVDIQWKLFNIVHNLLKIHRYGGLKAI